MTKELKAERIQLSPANLLEAMQRMLVERPKGWFNVCVWLDTNLVEYLRGDGPTPDWEAYPIARDWFSQNNVKLREVQS